MNNASETRFCSKRSKDLSPETASPTPINAHVMFRRRNEGVTYHHSQLVLTIHEQTIVCNDRWLHTAIMNAAIIKVCEAVTQNQNEMEHNLPSLENLKEGIYNYQTLKPAPI